MGVVDRPERGRERERGKERGREKRKEEVREGGRKEKSEGREIGRGGEMERGWPLICRVGHPRQPKRSSFIGQCP